MTMESCKVSDSDEVKSDLDEDYQDVLQELPQVLVFIRRLQDHIKWQRKKLKKLRNKLSDRKKEQLAVSQKTYVDSGVQTDFQNLESNVDVSHNWTTNDAENGENIVDQVKKTAESALQQTGFVYEETSGLYYDYNTGYYYDAEQGLYYDGNSGTYYYYDKESKTYHFHSQAQVSTNEAILQEMKNEKKEKRKAEKANKDAAKKQKVTRIITPSGKEEHEEGECSDSDNSSSGDDIKIESSSSNESEIEQESAKIYPPCMRIIVKETSVPKLKLGSLFVVAYTGGSMGREGDHSVLIPDINISKQHARFQYNEPMKQYEIVDLGSRNGTLLNGKRLSVAKQESEPTAIVHGSIVQIGSTKLLCHIHNGHETCGHCEPGLVQTSLSTDENTTSKKEQHKSELRRLKHKFGVEKDNVMIGSQLASGYQDRAQARRRNVGSSNHHAKTQQSSVDTSITKDNKGFKLLSKMGWSEGQSLGKDGDGRMEPVLLLSNSSKAGLGASKMDGTTTEPNPTVEKKQALWKKTQQRYQDIID